MSVFDATKGHLRWQRSLPESTVLGAGPAVAGDTIVIALVDGTVRAFDAASGEERWQTRLDGPFFVQPCVANGTVYAGSAAARMDAIDAANGDLLRAHETELVEDGFRPGAIHSAPAIVDDVLYVGSEDHRVHALAGR